MSAADNHATRAFQLSTVDDDGIESLMSSFRSPTIRISNEPELRLELKELDKHVVEQRFLAYAEEDKGILKSSSQAGSYCKPAYLEAIRHNIDVVKKACQLEIDEGHELLKDVTMAAKAELSRLQRHPALFPSKDTREEFWRSVWLACNDSVEFIMLKQEARDHAHSILQAAWMDFDEDLRIPGRDTQRKPWEQFLHNRAPGTEADLSMFATEGSLQIIPMAAARILIANIDEHKAIIRDIETQRQDLRQSAPSSGNELNSNNLKHSPDGHLRSHKAFTDLFKPTAAGPIDIVRREDMNSLETLNLDFAALTQRRSPWRPRLWNSVSVVLHDGPNYDVDSKQRNERVDEMMSIFTSDI